MSGGSYDYVYNEFSRCAEELSTRHPKEPHILALANFISSIGELMHDIEWADSGDSSWDENLHDRIRKFISPDMELHVAMNQALEAKEVLENAIKRKENIV